MKNAVLRSGREPGIRTYLNICTAHAERMDRHLDTWLGAAGINDHVRAGPQFCRLDQVLCILFRRNAFALERMCRGVVQRKLGPLLIDVHRDNLLRAVRLRNRTAQQTHRAGTKYNNAVTGLDSSLPRDVHGNGSRFDQRALLHGHVLRKLIAKVLRESVVPCQRAVIRRSGRKGHSRTKVVFALETPHAPPAGNAGLHCDAVANFQRRDLVAYGSDDACRFVAEHHGRLYDEVSNAAMHPVVHVGAADTGPSRLDEHIVWRLQLWDRPILVGEAVRFFKNERRVLHANC